MNLVDPMEMKELSDSQYMDFASDTKCPDCGGYVCYANNGYLEKRDEPVERSSEYLSDVMKCEDCGATIFWLRSSEKVLYYSASAIGESSVKEPLETRLQPGEPLIKSGMGTNEKKLARVQELCRTMTEIKRLQKKCEGLESVLRSLAFSRISVGELPHRTDTLMDVIRDLECSLKNERIEREAAQRTIQLLSTGGDLDEYI